MKKGMKINKSVPEGFLREKQMDVPETAEQKKVAHWEGRECRGKKNGKQLKKEMQNTLRWGRCNVNVGCIKRTAVR